MVGVEMTIHRNRQDAGARARAVGTETINARSGVGREHITVNYAQEARRSKYPPIGIGQ